MVSTMTNSPMLDLPARTTSHEIVFAGDQVRLAGQLDYPAPPKPVHGYPLIFILHHACCNTRDDYLDYARIGLENGCAVFRWDKRGTGRSGASGRGSTLQDALNAYETAVSQAGIDRTRVLIVAAGAGTALFGNEFAAFDKILRPRAALLVANQLDPDDIIALDLPLQILMSAHDWNDPAYFGEAAAAAHRRAHSHGADAFISHSSSRLLLETSNDDTAAVLPNDVREVVAAWLRHFASI